MVFIELKHGTIVQILKNYYIIKNSISMIWI